MYKQSEANGSCGLLFFLSFFLFLGAICNVFFGLRIGPEKSTRYFPHILHLLTRSFVIEPIFMVPSSANPTFVGREEAFHLLEKLLHPNGGSQRRAALYGLGGIG